MASGGRHETGQALRRITSRFVLLIATAAVLPLVVYGYVSIDSLRTGTRGSVLDGNQKVARQVAEQVSMYMRHNTRVLETIGGELGATGMTDWQQDRILKNHVIEFPEFREITVFDQALEPLTTSSIATTRLTVPEKARQRTNPTYIAPVRVDDDLLPTTTIAVRLDRSQQAAAWIVGEISLEELWRTVDRIRVGTRG
jgi:hypothetical protein